MVDNLLQRAEILFEQKRYSEANKFIKEALAIDPNNIFALNILAESYLNLDKIEEAEKIIDRCISLAPNESHFYYLKAIIKAQEKYFDNSEKLLLEAIKIEPSEATYYAYYAHLKLIRKEFNTSLDWCKKALALDPENILALNTRSQALTKLNKFDEAYSTIEEALHHDPNNAYTHTNLGWNLLEKGDHKKALLHFKEALKLDPTDAYAKAGMSEAMKAKFIFYRYFLKYSFWIGNMGGNLQWGVIIGFYVLTRFVKKTAEVDGPLQTILYAAYALLILFALSTWLITPLMNLYLRTNSYGRHMLDDEEIKSSNLVGISLLVALISGGVYLATFTAGWLALTVFGFTMMLPLGLVFTESKPKNIFKLFPLVMGVIGILGTGHIFSINSYNTPFFLLYVISFIGFQWGANFFMIRENNR